MSLTNKGSKWERKNSLYLIFAFIPLLNCIPFFHMNSRVKNKKWNATAWVLVMLQLVLFAALFIVPTIDGPDYPYYSDIEDYILEKDYMNSEQRLKYEDDYSFTSSSEWKTSGEYAEYLKAADERYKRESEWKKQPEIISQFEKYDNFRSVQSGIQLGISAAQFIVWLIAIILAFSERPHFLKALEQGENKSSITNKINSINANVYVPTNTSISTVAVTATADTVSPKIDGVMKTVDVNSADEGILASLQGLTIIDAKKAVAYRNEHNGFNSIDEFFSCINAKPHIIASIENRLTVGNYRTANPQSNDNHGKRTIDL